MVVALAALFAGSAAVGTFASGAAAEPASQPGWPAAAAIDAGVYHSCALLPDGSVRCWGFSGNGQAGYGTTDTIGDDETPASAGALALGVGETATAIVTGDYHTCALLREGSVRCWGFGADGRLGYGNTSSIGDDESPRSAGAVDLGGHTVRAITAGGAHTCAILDDFTVRCWGFNFQGQLGSGNQDTIGDDEVPGSVRNVDLGVERTARAISAGASHTCAILDD